MAKTPADPREVDFCLADETKLRAPFEDYHYFRRHRPVFYHEGMKGWFVFRHDDVDRLFHDKRLSNDRTHGFVDTVPKELRAEAEQILCGPFRRWVLMLDGAEHKRVRRVLQSGFVEHAVEAFVPAIREMIDELLGAVAERGDGRMDVAREFAYALPVMVISSLLRVPREDQSKIREWSDGLADFFNDPPATIASTRRMIDCANAMMRYVADEVRELERNPSEGYLQDLLTPPEGDGLSHEDIAINMVILLLAGHETTRNLIGSATSFLLDLPEQRALALAEPDHWRNVVEETLRMEPANPQMPRVATEEIEIHGETISAGQLVYLSIGSANRDPEHFERGDEFDIRREHGKHLAFGSGPHYCPGAILARREAAMALQALFERFPRIRRNEERPAVWVHYAGMRGPRSLPVRID